MTHREQVPGDTRYGEARLRPPRPTPGARPRSRLSEILARNVATPVTLVHAPAGTGKTTAVADWARTAEPDTAVVWVSADESDRELGPFWRTLVAALGVALPTQMRSVVAPRGPDIGFLQDVCVAAGGVTIVLDDADRLTGASTSAWLGQLLRRPPRAVAFILVSRAVPQISDSRLRVEGRLAEVGLPDLRFSAAETGALLHHHGRPQPADEIERLLDATGGWAAAVELAALDLHTDPAWSGRPGDSTRRYVQDEVLAPLAAEIVDFLTATSVADRLTVGLAEAMSGRDDAACLLERVEDAQLASREAPDSSWYRVEPLVRLPLLRRLEDQEPRKLQALQRCAATWHARRGDWDEALRQAMLAGDWELIGAMIVGPATTLVRAPGTSPVAEALARIPLERIAAHPELALAHAALAHREGALDDTEGYLRVGQRGLEDLPEARRRPAAGLMALIEADQAFLRGDGPALRRFSGQAVELLRMSDDVRGRDPGPAVALLGVAELWTGQPEKATGHLAEASVFAAAQHGGGTLEVEARGLLAVAHAMHGANLRAEECAASALTWAAAQGLERTQWAQWAWLARAIVMLDGGDLSGALGARQRCVAVAGSALNPLARVLLGLVTARQLLTVGDLPGTRRALERTGESLAWRGGNGFLHHSWTALRVRLAIARREHDTAAALLAEATSEAQVTLPVTLAKARLQLASGSPDSVRETLADALTREEGAAEAWLLLSLAEDQQRREATSVEALARALDLAAEERTALPLLFPNHQLVRGLRRHRDLVGTHSEFIVTALATSSPAERPEDWRPRALTDREHAVLLYLPTMCSNAEIAEFMSVSENTVKQHLKSIYRKLEAGSRREAVRVARDSGLLDSLRGAG